MKKIGLVLAILSLAVAVLVQCEKKEGAYAPSTHPQNPTDLSQFDRFLIQGYFYPGLADLYKCSDEPYFRLHFKWQDDGLYNEVRSPAEFKRQAEAHGDRGDWGKWREEHHPSKPRKGLVGTRRPPIAELCALGIQSIRVYSMDRGDNGESPMAADCSCDISEFVEVRSMDFREVPYRLENYYDTKEVEVHEWIPLLAMTVKDYFYIGKSLRLRIPDDVRKQEGITRIRIAVSCLDKDGKPKELSAEYSYEE